MAESDWVTGIKEGYLTKTIKVGNCTARSIGPFWMMQNGPGEKRA